MHQPMPEQGAGWGRWYADIFAYHAVPTNARAIKAFVHYVTEHWKRALRRRSQKDGSDVGADARMADDWLPKPRIHHPCPQQRFIVKHPR